MKSIVMFLMLVSLVGCASKRMAKMDNTAQTVETKAEEKMEERVELFQGKVRGDEGCGFCIEIIVDHEVVRLYAINLPDEFKQKNIKIEFSYLDSRAMLPEFCKASKVVTVENVKQLTQ